MIINTNFNKDLETGDFIIVSIYAGSLILGFYLGRGQGESIQFYTFRTILWWYNYTGQNKPKYPYKSYIQGSNTKCRMAKYHPDLITGEKEKEEYYKCVEILKSLNIIRE